MLQIVIDRGAAHPVGLRVLDRPALATDRLDIDVGAAQRRRMVGRNFQGHGRQSRAENRDLLGENDRILVHTATRRDGEQADDSRRISTGRRTICVLRRQTSSWVDRWHESLNDNRRRVVVALGPNVLVVSDVAVRHAGSDVLKLQCHWADTIGRGEGISDWLGNVSSQTESREVLHNVVFLSDTLTQTLYA